MISPSLVIAGLLGLGGPELVIILVIMMLLFGGSKLPELAKGLGKSIAEFKRASSEDAPHVAPESVPGLAASLNRPPTLQTQTAGATTDAVPPDTNSRSEPT